MNDLMILLPAEASRQIRSGGAWGHLAVRVSDPDGVGIVVAISTGTGPRMPVPLEPRDHFLAAADSRSVGYWYRVDADLHAAWLLSRQRRGTVTLDGFSAFGPSGYKRPGGGSYLAVTYAPTVADVYPDVGVVPEIAGWHVSARGAEPVDVEVQPDLHGMPQLAEHWPVADLAERTVLIVGAGSIGGAATHALAGYGVGRVLLLDPDRLLWRNLVRHVSSSRAVGRHKVNALRDDLQKARPDTAVEAYSLNVVADADQVRALLTRTDLVLCAADGVAPRRVVSHLARRARVDAVLACVLEDGGLGEVLRLRPWADRGCLICQRETLIASGGLDVEPTLDAGYGTGTRHRPMTAVGSDLHLVGQLAAKVTVATLLERRGHPDQRLPGDHAVIALRPQPGWAPPFDVDRAGEVRWLPVHPPRPGCPTCEPP